MAEAVQIVGERGNVTEVVDRKLSVNSAPSAESSQTRNGKESQIVTDPTSNRLLEEILIELKKINTFIQEEVI